MTFPPPTSTGGVALNGSYIYWTGDQSIGRANLDGTGVDPSFIMATGPNDVAADVAVDGTYIYWTNHSGQSIGRANLDGTGVEQSFISLTGFPVGIAVVPEPGTGLLLGSGIAAMVMLGRRRIRSCNTGPPVTRMASVFDSETRWAT